MYIVILGYSEPLKDVGLLCVLEGLGLAVLAVLALVNMRLLACSLLACLVCAWSVAGETTIELNGSNAYVDIAELVRR